MGDPKHVSWIQKGVESWNNKRIEEPFRPDLEGEDISAIFDVDHSPVTLHPPSPVLRGINLSQADLNGATLENFDFSEADFFDASFNGAKLNGSQFTGIKFRGSDFRCAKLNKANLTGVEFENVILQSAEMKEANLTGATFSQCDLKGVDFFNANLGGANFPLSRPWKAYLFGRPTSNACDDESFKSEYINSVSKLLEECRDFRKRHGDDVVLYFRGEGSCTRGWQLRPKVLREPGESDHLDIRLVEGEMLNDLMTREPDTFNALDSALGGWVLAQHYKLPTRFLDITRNPLVALFNACCDDKYECEDGRLHIFAVPRSLIKSFSSDTVSVIANFAKLPRWEKNLLLGKVLADTNNREFHRLASVKTPELLTRVKIRLYDSIRQEKPYFAERIDVRDLFRVFVVEPQRMFERIRAQSGAFLISAFHERFELDPVLGACKNIPVYSHFPRRISQKCKDDLMEDLRVLNVTQETMYPSLDTSAAEIEQRYLDRDESFYDNLTPLF